jgi:hypothetical protein
VISLHSITFSLPTGMGIDLSRQNLVDCIQVGVLSFEYVAENFPFASLKT